MKFLIVIFFATSTALVCNAQTQRINFKMPLLYPEGVTYNNSNKLFYVSSVKTGTIGTVDNNGSYRIFYEDSSLKSTFGMKTDEKRNYLWVCAGDPNYSNYSDSSTFKKMIRLVALDIASGKKVKDIDLTNVFAGKHFANDLTLDDEGNIYITDSYSPVIYKIDKDDKATVFAQSNNFKSPGIGLNGIVWNAKGFLLVVNNGEGAIYKVDIKDPSNISRVKIKNFFPGADGLLLDKQNNLLLVQNKSVNTIYKIASSDDWKTAEVKASTKATDRFQNPSTCTLQGDKVFVLNSKLNELDTPTIKPSDEFSVQLAVFMQVK